MTGLLLIDKPEGITSFRAVSQIRRITGEKKCGHTGTLDPMASGVLPILVGRATALSDFMLEADKEYLAVFRFGFVTDTDDITGNIIENSGIIPSEDAVISALSEFTGEIEQVPPDFSAIKQNGVAMYKLARQGEKVSIPSRRITVYEFLPVSHMHDGEMKFKIKCSKGTYIRSLCRDLGAKLGCGATLSFLRRTNSYGFSVDDCLPIDKLTYENVSSYIIKPEKIVSHFEKITVTEKQAVRFLNGGPLDFARLRYDFTKDGEFFGIYFEEKLLGIGFANFETQSVKIRCLFENEI